MRIRVRFEKKDYLRFVGHLDMMRYFQKAFARAKVAVRYSAGFHPHPILSFAAPLGLGLTSEGEYMDLEVEESGSSREMMARLNAVMAQGVRVTGWRQLPEETKKNNNAMALVGLAEYRVRLREAVPEAECQAAVDAFLAQEEIVVSKKTKKSLQEVNLRPWIHLFRYEPETRSYFLRLDAGSKNNLKPELVMEVFLKFLGKAPRTEETGGLVSDEMRRRIAFEICRLDLLTAQGVSLGNMGEEIA